MADDPITDAFASAFRTYEADGVPASGNHKVSKADARDLATVINAALNDLSAGQVAGIIIEKTWAALAVRTTGPTGDALVDGIGAEVTGDAGTHTDPVVGGSVSNSGRFRYESNSPSGWERIGDAAFQENVDAAEAAQEAAEAAEEAIRSYLSLPRLVLLGDSIVQANHSPLDPAFSTVAAGEIAQAHAIYPYFEWDSWLDLADDHDITGCNLGQSGWRADEVSGNIPAAKLMAADAFFLAAGINDIGQSQSGASTASDIQAAAESLRATGKPVIVANIRCVTDVTKHAAINTCNAALDAWWATNPVGIIPCDLRSIYSTPTSSPPDPTPLSGLTSDGTHPVGKGAQKAAPLIVACLKQAFKSVVSTKPRGTNLRPNPTFTGTGGALSGVTGTMATGWMATKTVGTSTVVGSRSGGNQILTVTHAAAGAATELVYASADTGFAATVEAGKWYQWWAELTLDGWAGFKGVRIGAGALGDALYCDGTTDGYPTTDPITLTVISAPVLADAGGGINVIIFIWIDGTVSGSGVITLLEAGLAEVPDPRPLHGFET